MKIKINESECYEIAVPEEIDGGHSSED